MSSVVLKNVHCDLRGLALAHGDFSYAIAGVIYEGARFEPVFAMILSHEYET